MPSVKGVSLFYGPWRKENNVYNSTTAHFFPITSKFHLTLVVWGVAFLNFLCHSCAYLKGKRNWHKLIKVFPTMSSNFRSDSSGYFSMHPHRFVFFAHHHPLCLIHAGVVAFLKRLENHWHRVLTWLRNHVGEPPSDSSHGKVAVSDLAVLTPSSPWISGVQRVFQFPQTMGTCSQLSGLTYLQAWQSLHN